MDDSGFVLGIEAFEVGFHGDFNTTPEDPNNYRFQNGDTFVFENGDNYEFN